MAIDPAWTVERGACEHDTRWREDAEERVLVLRIQQGEREVAGELYERYFDRVYAYLHASLDHRADAEDVAQQVFANVLEALGRYDVDGASSFRGWLFVIARNQLRKSLRGRWRMRVLADDDLAARIEREHSIPDPAERFSGWALDAAVAKLPERARQVILLRFIGDLKPGEIARILQISEDAVHQAQRRGLDILEGRLVAQSPSGRVLRVPMARRDPALPVCAARRMALLAA